MPGAQLRPFLLRHASGALLLLHPHQTRRVRFASAELLFSRWGESSILESHYIIADSLRYLFDNVILSMPVSDRPATVLSGVSFPEEVVGEPRLGALATPWPTVDADRCATVGAAQPA